jgi:gluconolactonase
MKHTVNSTLAIVLIWALSSCLNKKSDNTWSERNDKVIAEYDIEGRTRSDIQDSKLEPNIKPGEKINYNNLPSIELAEGVTSKTYWGKGGLMSFVTMEPNSTIPEKIIEGERFLFVLEGSIQETIKGQNTTLRAVAKEAPGAVLSAMPVNEFVYLQQGAKTAIIAGTAGAKLLEVYSPAALDYLKKAGYTDIPASIDIEKYPVEPNVEPNKVYDLNDFQYTELLTGANSRIITGKGVQMSFINMDPDITFPHHMHPEEQVMTVLRGYSNQIIMDTIIKLEPGDVIDLPSGMVHGGTMGPQGCDAIDIFFPPRADYNEMSIAKHKKYNAIIPADAKVKLVIDGSKTKPGLTFTEGPTWLNGKLYFSNMFFDEAFNGDPKKSTLVEMDPDGTYRNIVKNKMQTNGLISNNNNLIVCDMFGHRVLEMNTKGEILKVLADKFDGKSIDGPNDLIMDSKGGIYFSDPQFTSDAVKNQPGRTVYYRNPEGKVIRLLEPNAFAMPNGVALSPDGKTLYINNTYDNESWWNVDSDKDNYIWAYDVNNDGTIANGRKFAALVMIPDVLDRGGRSSGADGMKIDVEGNLYIGTWAGIQIIDKTGKSVGIINTPDYPVSCAFGGDDMKTLYITAVDKIYSIRTNIAGYVPESKEL